MNTHPVVNILLRSVSKGAVVTPLLVAALILVVPFQALAQLAPDATSAKEDAPVITIVKPSSGRVFRPNELTGSDGKVPEQRDETSLTTVMVVIHRLSGGGGEGYLNGHGAFVSDRVSITAYVRPVDGVRSWSIGTSFPAGDDIGEYGIQATARNSAGLIGTASAHFSIAVSEPLVNPQVSQAFSDGLRAAGFTDDSRFFEVINNDADWLRPHFGTHQQSGVHADGTPYGNAIDIMPVASTPAGREAEIHALRMQGIAAWYRSTPGNEHYHIVGAMSSTRNSYNQEQIAAFNQRLNGYATEATETNQPISDDEARAVRNAFNSVPGQNIDDFRVYRGTH